MFGDFVKDLRVQTGLTLREFCRISGEDPSNWSKIERNQLQAPQDEGRLLRIAGILKVEEEARIQELKDLAEVSAGNIPKYIMDQAELVNCLPAFLRTIDNIKPSREEFERLISKLQEG